MRLAQAALQLSDAFAVLFVRTHRGISSPQRGYRRFFDVLLPALEQRGCDVVVAAGREAVLSRVREKAKEMDPKKLSRAVSLYGKYSTQKKFQEMLKPEAE